MKKNLLPLIIALTLALNASAQLVPNNSFETWETTGQNCYMPQSWTTLFMFCTSPNVHQSTSSYSGNYSAKLDWVEVYSTLMGGSLTSYFHTNSHPLSFRMHLKGSFTHGSTFDASVILYKNNDMIAGGSFSITSVSNDYTEYAAPIEYFSETDLADSAWIVLAIGGDDVTTAGDEILIDNVVLSQLPVGIKQQDFSQATIFPVPSAGTIFINSAEEISTIAIYDITGKIVYHTSGDHCIASAISVEYLPSGIYQAKLNFKNGRSENHKLVIAR